jgi:hypothetical protein
MRRQASPLPGNERRCATRRLHCPYARDGAS